MVPSPTRDSAPPGPHKYAASLQHTVSAQLRKSAHFLPARVVAVSDQLRTRARKYLFGFSFQPPSLTAPVGHPRKASVRALKISWLWARMTEAGVVLTLN